MGHESPLTTLGSYGHLSTERQAKIINGLGRNTPTAMPPSMPDDAMARKIAEIVAEKIKSPQAYYAHRPKLS